MTILDLFTDYTLRNVALGSALLGIVSGVLGCFAVLRRQGLLGDALAHAALPGVCLAYMLTGSKAPLVLLVGAGISGWLGAWLLLRIVRDTKISEDTSLGIAVSYLDLRGTLGGITLNQTGRELECMTLMMLIYLIISLIISAVMNAYNASVKLKER